MHPVARLKTHALRRIMERAPGLCPGLVLRCIDAAVETDDPLIAFGGEALYRVRIGDLILCVIVTTILKHYVTVMTVPCRANIASRAYLIGTGTIEKVKNKYATERNDKWRRLKRARQARERFL